MCVYVCVYVRVGWGGGVNVCVYNTLQSSVAYQCLPPPSQVPGYRQSLPHGHICSDNFTCCHTEMEVSGQTRCLIYLQHTVSVSVSDPSRRQHFCWMDKLCSIPYIFQTCEFMNPSFLTHGHGEMNKEVGVVSAFLMQCIRKRNCATCQPRNGSRSKTICR